MSLNNIRTFDGSFLNSLASCINVVYYGKEIKLENLPRKLINDGMSDDEIDEYGCLKNPTDLGDLTHDAYIEYNVWFDDGITISNMEKTLNTIDKIKKAVYGNENVDKESIEILENKYKNTCLDFNYCVKFNFV